jgi:hypothetical protein
VVATVGSRRVVDITERDLGVLTFAVEMFGLPLPLVAELIGRASPGPLPLRSAERIARRTVARLEAGRYARRASIRREVWVVPRAAGLALAQSPEHDKPYGLWSPQGWKAEHLAGVARLRLWLQDHYPEARWEPERAIRRRCADANRANRAAGVELRTRYADGGLYLPDGRAVGIELELTRKPSADYAGIVADQDPAWSTVWWYTRPGLVAGLTAALREAGAIDHHVFPLSGELAGVIS